MRKLTLRSLFAGAICFVLVEVARTLLGWIGEQLTTEILLQFCAELGVTWGRIDLLEANGELLFLEYNANGQWVFLDYSNKVGLMKKVLDYLTQTACPK